MVYPGPRDVAPAVYTQEHEFTPQVMISSNGVENLSCYNSLWSSKEPQNFKIYSIFVVFSLGWIGKQFIRGFLDGDSPLKKSWKHWEKVWGVCPGGMWVCITILCTSNGLGNANCLQQCSLPAKGKILTQCKTVHQGDWISHSSMSCWVKKPIREEKVKACKTQQKYMPKQQQPG